MFNYRCDGIIVVWSYWHSGIATVFNCNVVIVWATELSGIATVKNY